MGTSNGERERLGRQILVKAGDGKDESDRKSFYFCLFGETLLLLVEAIIWYLARRKKVRLFRFMLSAKGTFILFLGLFLLFFIVGGMLLESKILDKIDSFFLTLTLSDIPWKVWEIVWTVVLPIIFCVFCTWIGYEGYRYLLYWSIGSDIEFTFWGNPSASIISIASINLGVFIHLFCIRYWRKTDFRKKLKFLMLTLLVILICFINDREQLKELNALSDGEAVTIEEFERDGEDETVTERARWKVSDVRGLFLRATKEQYSIDEMNYKQKQNA